MVWTLQSLVEETVIGAPLTDDTITIVPLRRRTSSKLDYLTIDEAIRRQSVEIKEVSEDGRVSALTIVNNNPCLVFVPDGSTMIGCKQNRILNISLLLAPNSETQVPVSCVEQGRWNSRSKSFHPDGYGDKEMRIMLSRKTKESLEAGRAPQADQLAVWEKVRESLGDVGASSPTGDYLSAREKLEESRSEKKALECPKDACGVALLRDGFVEAIDIFDRCSTLEELWPRLAQGYRLTSMRPQKPARKTLSVEEVLHATAESEEKEFPNVGVGKSIRFEAAPTIGAALVHTETAVHVSIFVDGDGEIAPSNHQLPPEAPAPAEPKKEGGWSFFGIHFKFR